MKKKRKTIMRSDTIRVKFLAAIHLKFLRTEKKESEKETKPKDEKKTET